MNRVIEGDKVMSQPAEAIAPRQVYGLLSKPELSSFAGFPCSPTEKSTGKTTFLVKPDRVVFFTARHVLIVQKNGNASVVTLGGNGYPREDHFLVLDKNGNGIQEAGDSGDFSLLWQLTRLARRFADNPKRHGVQCKKIDKPVEQYTRRELLEALASNDFARFRDAWPKCPAGQNLIRGATLSTQGLDQGLSIYMHHLFSSIRYHASNLGITFMIGNCENNGLFIRGEDVDADGVLERSKGYQDRYDTFWESVRQLVRNPHLFSEPTCGPCSEKT